MKEMEVQQRHGSPNKPSAQFERPTPPRTFSHDQTSSPPVHQQSGFPRTGREPLERDRSGSDSSRDGHDRQRRMPLRGVSTSSDSRAIMTSHPVSQSPTRNRKRDLSEPMYLQNRGDFSDSRMHPSNLPVAAFSTPNLHAPPTTAPPLPPINPRRKNGMPTQGLRGGDAAGHAGHGDAFYDDSGDEQRRQLSRATIEQNDERHRQYPPAPSHRPPLPRGNMSSNSLPGGMI
ncbi:hypothetical protein NQ176_g10538 [Zarea fungicola]|uniref:Uncharacterized protein n=1 Tax=Zarea fungicola TaxID=93591 RepID=A0ACC1MG15_9HYPO|nr:hypothetical protein NQ176_g10538 [Lecanicillium fungicola]